MRRIEMIGTPLDHARSPGLLNAWFAARGMPESVVKRELGIEAVAAYVAAASADPSLIGVIVTTPLKHAMVAELAVATPLVTFLAATNCIRFDRDGWVGANFDGHGFVAALAALDAGAGSGRRVLIAGCGGAGAAIAASLARQAPAELVLHDIDGAKAGALATRLSSFAPDTELRVTATPTGAFDIVVNASTAGMAPGDAAPFPDDTVAAAGIVADIVTVADTALKATARRLGKPLLEGDAMVAGQADLLRRFLLGAAREENDVLRERDVR